MVEADYEKWQDATGGHDGLIWLDHSSSKCKVTMILDDDEFMINYPKQYPGKLSSYSLETKSKKLAPWIELINEALSGKSKNKGDAKIGEILDIAMSLRSSGKSKSKKHDDEDEVVEDDEDAEMGGMDEDEDMSESAAASEEYMGDDFDLTSDNFQEGLEVLRKKKLWAKKESELRAQLQTERSGKKVDTIFSSTAALGVLTNDLIFIMKESAKLGFMADPVDDNIYCWNVKMFNFKPDSQIAADLINVKNQYGYNYVELEVSFTIDLYPFYPPTIRVVRPRLQGFMMGRVTSMDILKLSHWDPVRDMRGVIEVIRDLLEEYGHLDVNNPLNDIKANPGGAYSRIEYLLLRLELLSETAPRANVKYPDLNQLVKPSASTTAPKKEVVVESPGKKSKKTYWAAGTGYGSGSTSTGGSWDVNAYLAAQKQKDSETEALFRSIHKELAGPGPFQYDVLEESCIVPVLDSYLRNDSLLDMGRHVSLYTVIFDICREIASNETLLPLLDTLPGQAVPLIDLLKGQYTRANLMVSRVSEETDQASVQLANAIVTTYTTAQAGLKKLAADISALEASRGQQKAPTPAAAINVAPDKMYMTQMAELQFDVVKMDISGHHYASSRTSSTTSIKSKVIRLAQEQATISTSLPLTLDSSVFVRVSEENMDYMRALITGPMASDYGITSTPYCGGCFMFDIHMPYNYPDSPPQVNLQTTGNGAVRFNPNLYNCGKVCLSLLGTWSGAEGETWNKDTSTLLQVLVSIQSLIMVPQPFFNEPGYESQIGTPQGDNNNRQYNEVIRCGTIEHAVIGQLRNPSPGFEEVIRRHFYLQQNRVTEQAERWLAEAAASTSRAHYSRLLKLVQTMKEEFAKLSYPYPPLPKQGLCSSRYK